MRHDFIDRYSRLDSPIHRLPAFLKFSVAISIVVGNLTVPISVYIYFASLLGFLAAIAVLSTIHGMFLIRRMLFLGPFVIGASFFLLFRQDGGVAFTTMLVKSTLCLLTIVLLSNTTPFDDLLRLLKRLRVPSLFITILALMYRYLFVLTDEVERMQRARSSRTFTGSKAHLWRTRAVLLSQLFVRSTERAERIYSSMRARGWR